MHFHWTYCVFRHCQVLRSLWNLRSPDHQSVPTLRLLLYDESNIWGEKLFEERVLYNDILTFHLLHGPMWISWLQIVSVARDTCFWFLKLRALNGSANLKNASTFTAGIATGSLMNSSFSSAPGTYAPYANISNFNVLLSNSAIFQTYIKHKFEQFLEENRVSLWFNWAQITEMSLGLIG